MRLKRWAGGHNHVENALIGTANDLITWGISLVGHRMMATRNTMAVVQAMIATTAMSAMSKDTAPTVLRRH